MPITSAQVNQMMAGQQAMFGNMTNYAQQLSPYGQQAPSPSYASPVMAMPGANQYNQGIEAAATGMNAIGTAAPYALAGAGMLMGGRVGGMLDPFTGAARGFGRAVSWQKGAGLAANLGRFTLGGVARGVGMGALGGLPGLAIGAGIQYTAGQMIEGAQFQSATNQFLQNNFRFTNPASHTGYGFTQQGMRGIGEMMQNMGTREIMSTPQEMLQIMKRGTQAGLFRGVQDAREFKQRFTQVKETLKEIAETFNTTLSDAMPFLQQARQQGFWTANDITRHARQVRTVQATTGMSAQQAQSVMGAGASMARSIGARGAQGATMMARSQALTGSALFGGAITSQQLSDAGFGTGAEGARNFGQMLAGASARFARSRVGRWALASMMNEEGTGLDQERLSQFTSGRMSVGQMRSLARRNVSGKRAYNFVMNEEELRGQLAEQGPEAAMGMVRSLVGGRLYSGDDRDRLITNRIIRRFMGGNKRQAELVAKMAREMPRLQEIAMAKSENALDAQGRQQDTMMRDSWEGLKRKLGTWWQENVTNPMQKMGAEIAHNYARTWQRFSDSLFGTGGRSINLSDFAVSTMRQSALTGNTDVLDKAFGSDRLRRQLNRMTLEEGGLRDPIVGEAEGMEQDMRGAMMGLTGRGEARALGYSGTNALLTARRGEGAQGIQKFLRSREAIVMRGEAGARLDQDSARALAKRYVEKIRAGAAGGAAQRELSGVSEQQAIGRLIQLQGGAAAGFTGVGVTKEEPGYNTRAALEQARNQAVEDVANTMMGYTGEGSWLQRVKNLWSGGGIAGVDVDERSINELRQDPDAQAALRLYAEADAAKNPDEKERLREQARNMMQTVSMKEGLSDGARSAAIKAIKGGAGSEQLEDKLAKLGKIEINADRFAREEKVKARMTRLRRRLGGEGTAALTKAAGDRDVTQALMDVINPAKNETAKQRQAKMETLAAKMMEDPAATSRMLAVLRQRGLGQSELGGMLSAAEWAGGLERMGAVTAEDEAAAATGRLRGKRMRRAVGGVGGILASMGIQTEGLNLKQLVRGGAQAQEAQDKLEGALKARGFTDGAIQEFMQDIQGGLTAEEMREQTIRGIVAKGVTSYSDKVAKEAGVKADALNMTGREGSMQEIGKNIKVQVALQRQMADGISKLAELDYNIVEKPKQSKEGES